MTYFIKKIQIVLTLLLITSIGYTYGEYGNSSACEESNCCCSCTSTCCGGKGFISADLLYWRAFEDGLDNCFPIENCDDVCSRGTVISKFRGRGRDPKFDWDAGFRLGTGYEFGCNLDIAVYWTHFYSHSNRHHKNECTFRNSHEVHWKLHFDVIDVVVGHKFDLGSCFKLRPFGGVRGARIEQKLRTDFLSIANSCAGSNSAIFFADSNSCSSSTNHFTSSSDSRQRFFGVGPLVGIEADWNLGCGLSLYANASVSTLYGDFRIHFNESDEFINGFEYCYIKQDMCGCQAVIDTGIGIRWLTCCYGNTLWLQLGLEQHRYFNQNRIGGYGDLCLDGVNFGAGVAF